MSFQPQIDRIYYFKNQHSQKVIGVDGGSNQTQRGKNLIQYTPLTVDDQKWIIFPLDGGLYAITNRKSGYVMAVSQASTKDGATICQWDWTNGNEQKWSFTSISGAYYIVNHKSGKVIGVSQGSTKDRAAIIQWTSGVRDQLWTFPPLETFRLPAAPTVGTLPDIPRFTGPGQNLPDRSNPVVTANTYFPCIMVVDSWGVALKSNETPYYLMKKQEYWEKVFQQDIPAHGKIEKEEAFGMRTTDQQTMEHTTGITVGRDAGFSFKGASASISRQVTNELKVTQSVTTEVMQEYKTKYVYDNPTATNTSYAKYQRVVEYTLSRTNGTQISSVWTVKKENDTRTTTWPANASVSERQLSTVTMSEDERFKVPPSIDSDEP